MLIHTYTPCGIPEFVAWTILQNGDTSALWTPSHFMFISLFSPVGSLPSIENADI